MRRNSVTTLVCAFAIMILVACGDGSAATPTITDLATPGVTSVTKAATNANSPTLPVATKATTSNKTTVATAVAVTATPVAKIAATTSSTAVAAASKSASAATPAAKSTATTANTGDDSVKATVAKNAEAHDDAKSYLLDANKATLITLNGDTIKADGKGVTVDGSKATITTAGTYSIRGTLADGQIIVNTKDKEPVKLILNGATLSSASSAPIYVMDAEETVIILADNTENRISDGKKYVFANPTDDEPNAAIFSKSDLTIYGGGSLTVTGNFNDGIASKDGLVIASGTIAITAADDGIRGKDYLVVRDGLITVNAKGDGLKSDNAEDATKGYIAIENGTLKITAGGDAIQAETDVTVSGGALTLSSGGGYKARVDENTSAKGIKGGASVVIDGGTFAIDAADDAIHSNDGIVINGGKFVMATGDDGMHADATLKVNGGDIRITNSYEGIESAVITINGGDIHLVSSDDGLNVAGGSGGSGMGQPPAPGGRPGRPGGPGQDAFTYTGKQYLYINGGYVAIEAGGDGIDVNGAITMTDGVVIVNGPIQQMNSALDYDAFFNISGGFLVAAGQCGHGAGAWRGIVPEFAAAELQQHAKGRHVGAYPDERWQGCSHLRAFEAIPVDRFLIVGADHRNHL